MKNKLLECINNSYYYIHKIMSVSIEHTKYLEDIKKYPDESYNVAIKDYNCIIRRISITHTLNGYIILDKPI